MNQKVSTNCYKIYLRVHFIVDDELLALLPVAVPHRLGSGDDMLTHRFRRSDQRLTFARPQLLVVRLRDHSAARVELVRGHVGDLHEHGGHEVDAFEHLQVDVHVERDLALLLYLLLLRGALVVTLKTIRKMC